MRLGFTYRRGKDGFDIKRESWAKSAIGMITGAVDAGWVLDMFSGGTGLFLGTVV